MPLIEPGPPMNCLVMWRGPWLLVECESAQQRDALLDQYISVYEGKEPRLRAQIRDLMGADPRSCFTECGVMIDVSKAFAAKTHYPTQLKVGDGAGSQFFPVIYDAPYDPKKSDC